LRLFEIKLGNVNPRFKVFSTTTGSALEPWQYREIWMFNAFRVSNGPLKQLEQLKIVIFFEVVRTSQ
jgi:hypothetical protein